MKKKYLFYLTSITIILISSCSFGQTENNTNEKTISSKEKIVQKLNTPEKKWVHGYWKINKNGHRVWERGFWKFEEKTFQEKSKILRKELTHKNRT